MRVTKTVSFADIDVDVEIDGAEMVAAIFDGADDLDASALIKRLANAMAALMNNMSDAQLGTLNRPSRDLITKYFEDQAKRLRRVQEELGEIA